MPFRGHHNFKYTGDIPNAAGDRYWSQDLSRDFAYFESAIAEAASKGEMAPGTLLQIGEEIIQGSGDVLVVPPFLAYGQIDRTIPGDFGSAQPPATSTVTNGIIFGLDTVTNVSVTTTLGATLDGDTVNYIFASPVDEDVYSRPRAKSVGTYAYELATGVSFRFSASPNSSTGEACLGWFVGIDDATTTNEWIINTDYGLSFGGSAEAVEEINAGDPVGIVYGGGIRKVGFEALDDDVITTVAQDQNKMYNVSCWLREQSTKFMVLHESKCYCGTLDEETGAITQRFDSTYTTGMTNPAPGNNPASILPLRDGTDSAVVFVADCSQTGGNSGTLYARTITDNGGTISLGSLNSLYADYANQVCVCEVGVWKWLIVFNDLDNSKASMAFCTYDGSSFTFGTRVNLLSNPVSDTSALEWNTNVVANIPRGVAAAEVKDLSLGRQVVLIDISGAAPSVLHTQDARINNAATQDCGNQGFIQWVSEEFFVEFSGLLEYGWYLNPFTDQLDRLGTRPGFARGSSTQGGVDCANGYRSNFSTKSFSANNGSVTALSKYEGHNRWWWSGKSLTTSNQGQTEWCITPTARKGLVVMAANNASTDYVVESGLAVGYAGIATEDITSGSRGSYKARGTLNLKGMIGFRFRTGSTVRVNTNQNTLENAVVWTDDVMKNHGTEIGKVISRNMMKVWIPSMDEDQEFTFKTEGWDMDADSTYTILDTSYPHIGYAMNPIYAFAFYNDLNFKIRNGSFEVYVEQDFNKSFSLERDAGSVFDSTAYNDAGQGRRLYFYCTLARGIDGSP
jgi:hypothetical protein